MLSFELDWGEVVEGRMPAAGVVPALDVLEHRGPRLAARRPGLAVDALFLDAGVEGLADGVRLCLRLRLMGRAGSELFG